MSARDQITVLQEKKRCIRYLLLDCMCMLTPVLRSITEEHILLGSSKNFFVIRATAAPERIERKVSETRQCNFLLSSWVPILSDPLEVFLGGVVYETDNIALLVNRNKASTNRDNVFNVQNVVLVEILLAGLDC
jgi:hypothetical protein